MKMKLATFAVTALTSFNTLACIHFQIESDGSFINGRSMEFGVNIKNWESLPSEFFIYKKGSKFINNIPVSKYGFAGIRTYDNLVTEGVNEKGVSMAGLWFTNGEYPDNKKLNNSIPNTHLINWGLGQFSSAKDIVENLKKLNVYAPFVKNLGGQGPIHFSITDASGANYVVEFINKEIKVFDNTKNRVLTNDPRFDQQLSQLDQLYKKNPNLKNINTAGEFNNLSGGYGSTQRFQKISVLKSLLPKPINNVMAVNQSIGLLNNIDYPRGVPTYAEDLNQGRGDVKQETTWVSVIDLKNLKYYYRTSTNYNVKVVDLKKIGFNNNIQFNLFNDSGRFIDVTTKVK